MYNVLFSKSYTLWAKGLPSGTVENVNCDGSRWLQNEMQLCLGGLIWNCGWGEIREGQGTEQVREQIKNNIKTKNARKKV